MIGDRIKRKRLAAGMSLQDLADALYRGGIHLSKAALSNYETHKTVPNATTLWTLAKVFGVSMEYFIREHDAVIVLGGYRKRAGLSAKRHDQILAQIRDEIEKRIEIEAILSLQSSFALPHQKEINSIDEADQIATNVRDGWKLGDQPISSVSTLLEEKGWYVIQTPNEDDFDGLCGVVKTSNRPFVVSRSGISIDRLRLNLLHEVGHAFLKSSEGKLMEKAAFRFASAMLFPESRVYEEVGRKRSSFTIEELVLLKKRYGLSIQAMAFRFRDLGIISDSYFSLIFAYLNKAGFKVQEPGSQELTFQETSTTFQSQVYRALAEGLISETDAARFLPGHDTRAGTPRLGSSSDIKRILSLPKDERDRVLEAAAAAAVGDYESPEVNISDIVDDIKEYP